MANARVNFISYLISAPFCFLEANHVFKRALFSIKFYEFTDSSLLMLAANLGFAGVMHFAPHKLAWLLVTMPDQAKAAAIKAFNRAKSAVERLSCASLLTKE